MRWRLLALGLLAPWLAGCVAVAALPVLAGGAMIAGGNAKIRAATPRPAASASLGASPNRGELTAGTGMVLTELTALPPPDAVAAAVDPWRQFVAYALDRARGSGRHRSALLEAGTSLALPRTRACQAETPAVLIDLDPGTRPFIPAAVKTAPPPALVEGLAQLREAGVVVVWISGLPADYVSGVAEALRASGLDPAGEDPLLLVRNREDRKQLLREEANLDVCVIAIAGDGKNDFDELFAYLRDPLSAQSLDSYLGAGWFLVPPPLD